MIHFFILFCYICILMDPHTWPCKSRTTSTNIQSATSSMQRFLPCSGRIDTAIWMHYMDSNKTAGEEARRQLHKNAASNLEQVLAATPHKTPTVRPPASYHENYSSWTNQTCRTLLEKQGRTHK